jgi:hypothetical protein
MRMRWHDAVTLVLMGAVTCGCTDTKPPDVKVEPAKPSAAHFEPTAIAMKEVPENSAKELLDESLTFVDSRGVRWTAPKGTWTDGASVPRLLLPITDDRFAAVFLKAAVVHDAYCQDFNEGRCPAQFRKKPWKDVHNMFYEACLAGGTDPLTAKLMFAGVWLSGPRWDDPASPLQQVPDETVTIAFSGCKDWIEKNDPKIEEIVADVHERENLAAGLYDLESKSQSALEESDWKKADTLLQEEEKVLSKALNKSPNDVMLHNFHGYWFKNRAMVKRYGEKKENVDEDLANAEKAFRGVVNAVPKDSSAHKGLGSVAMLRGDLDGAEKHVRKALEVAPASRAAKSDLEKIGKERRRRAKPQDR